MELFHSMAEMGHERVLFCSHPQAGLRAIIAVHSTALGPGLGGVRMWPYASDEEALLDVLRLSRGMTYKAAAAGLNLGGGKAVILGDPRKDKSEALFRSFGRYVESLGGVYVTAEDVGTGMADMDQIRHETRWVTGVSPAHGGHGDPSQATAFGVLQGMKAAVRCRFGGDSLCGRSVALQGIGSVGYLLGEYLKAEGAKLFAADIDPARAARAESELGAEIVPPGEVLEVDCDVVAPCALGAVLDDRSIPRLRCKIVAGSANNQLADETRHGKALHDRGILYAPDFVINAGGLLHVYNELLGEDGDTAMRMAAGIYDNLTRILELSAAQAMPTEQAANRIAEERIRRLRTLGDRHWSRAVRRRGAAA
jgi:leucine dehydrogenase